MPLSIWLTNWMDGRQDRITHLMPTNVRLSRHWMALDGFTLFCSNSESLVNVNLLWKKDAHGLLLVQLMDGSLGHMIVLKLERQALK